MGLLGRGTVVDTAQQLAAVLEVLAQPPPVPAAPVTVYEPFGERLLGADDAARL